MSVSRKRRTLRGEISFDGVGIHSGQSSSVKISPREEGGGITFSFGDNTYSIGEAGIDGTHRNTTLCFPKGEKLATVEHLLAAVIGMGLDDVLISPDGSELPILDGSAGVFANGFAFCGFEEFGSFFIQPTIAAPVCVEMGRSSLVALPSDELRITYVVDYPGCAIGTEMKDVVITPESFMKELADARTFALLSEVESLRKSGLALGGDLDNALLIGDDGPAGTGYRIECECAAHKATDLLGDLATAGFVANGHYICVCGGHKLHAKLVDRLKNKALIDVGR
jgi:UDP-3-O-[3-hydroxymyristoyl] N-acetylglucosamine deacetylase